MDATNIIDQLVSQLGITQQQAQGGAGVLLKFAKAEMGDADFSKVAQFIPNVDSLMSQSPQPAGVGGMLGGLTSALGGKAAEIGGLANVASSFSALGLARNKIAPFATMLVTFVEQKGGPQVAALLKNVVNV